jgi:hypothetical protein
MELVVLQGDWREMRLNFLYRIRDWKLVTERLCFWKVINNMIGLCMCVLRACHGSSMADEGLRRTEVSEAWHCNEPG